MATEFFSDWEAINAMLEIAKELKELKDINDTTARNAAVAKLEEKIVSALASQATLVLRFRELEDEVVRLSDWGTEKQRYELKQVGRGTFVYVLKEDAARGEPPHWLCFACYLMARKSVLQAQEIFEGGQRVHLCPNCKGKVLV